MYWVATIWLSLGMLTSGILQLIQFKDEVVMLGRLGYPNYFMTILGVWKILGVATILLPKLPLLKEWAYAGFFFTATGALVSHVAVADEVVEFFGPALLIVLTVVSWYLRPASRKLNFKNQ